MARVHAARRDGVAAGSLPVEDLLEVTARLTYADPLGLSACACELRREGVRVDDGGDRIGGVVEAVDEFETERDQKRDSEQHERKDRRRSSTGHGDVRAYRIGHVEKTAGQHGENPERKPDVHRVIEMRFTR